MYQQMLSEGAYSNWNEYCTLNELAKREYEEEQMQEYKNSEEQ